MRSVMKHKFSEVPSVSIPRSRFIRNHGYKTTFDAGKLVPFLIDEIYPGDSYKVKLHGFARLATPIYPIMDNMFMETFFFFCPIRLLWEHWPNFMGERKPDPDSSIDFTIPVIDDVNGVANESIFDYFGLPTQVAAIYECSALPFRAYNLIFNEWFRDQNLVDGLTFNFDDGPDSIADYALASRMKRHDYFTSCLPSPQKGDSVLLSLGDTAPVLGLGKLNQTYPNASQAVYETGGNSDTYDYAAPFDVTSGANSTWYGEEDPVNTGYPFIRTDLSEAIGPSVNEFRQAVQVQRLLEKNMRAGTRYREILNSHFGVTSPDSRMMIPEYLGGGSSRVNVSAVARTDSSPGELGAVGVAQLEGHGFTKSFVEHGFIIGLVNVRADLTYQEGLERFWSRQTRLDFYLPVLAHLGEQAVLNKELYIDAASIGDGSFEDVFGYQERWAELRYKPSKVTGKFRSNDANTLDAWHLSQEFGSQPTLGETFITDNPPIDRVIATPTEPHFIFDSYIEMDCIRPLPTYSEPGYVDHF